MPYYLHCIKNYVNFSGRARRKEYWIFYLSNTIILLLLTLLVYFIGNMLGLNDDEKGVTILSVLGIYCVFIFLPSLAVAVRRFHDQDISGWMVLINLVPYVGGIIALVFMCLDGTRGENRFGPDTK